MVPRWVAALLAILAAALLVTGSLLPEFQVGGVGVAQIDPDRVGWVPSMVGMLVQVGLVLSGALMLLLGESRQVSGGILVGAGLLGLTLRVVRILQLTEAPGYDAAVGSWLDGIAEGMTVVAGVLALSGSGREADVDQYEEPEDDLEPLEATSPPAGDL